MGGDGVLNPEGIFSLFSTCQLYPLNHNEIFCQLYLGGRTFSLIEPFLYSITTCGHRISL